MGFFRTFQQLLPDGAAWRTTTAKTLRSVLEGLSTAPDAVRSFIDDVYDDLHPSLTRELTRWEDLFALVHTESEAVRRQRLAAAWKAIGGQSPRYLQDIVQAAGFDLYVHEWWASGPDPWVPRDPRAYTLVPLIGTVQCAEPSPYNEGWAQAVEGLTATDRYQQPATGPLGGGAAMTVSLLLWYRQDPGSDQVVLEHSTATGGWQASVQTGSRRFVWRITDAGGTDYDVLSDAAKPLVPGRFYGVTMSWNGTTQVLSVNDQVVSATPGATYAAPASSVAGMGAEDGGGSPCTGLAILGVAFSSGVALNAAGAAAQNLASLAAGEIVEFTSAEHVYRAPALQTDVVGATHWDVVGAPTPTTAPIPSRLVQCGDAAYANAFLANDPGYLVNLDLTSRPPPPVPDDPAFWPYFLYFGGAAFGDPATIPLSRRAELEELLLKLCPMQHWIVLMADYVAGPEVRVTLQGEVRVTLQGETRVTLDLL